MATSSVTQKQIAQRLGVSQRLVGSALHGGGRVGAGMRRQIIEAAEVMGYAPNATARMLKSGKTNTIALAYVKRRAVTYQRYNANIVLALAETMGGFGYKLDLRCGLDNDATMNTLQDVVRTRSADLVVLWGLDKEIEEQGELLESLGMPFIIRGYHEQAHSNWVQADFDHDSMIRDYVNKLADMGHERIAFLGHNIDMSYSRRFRDGYLAAMLDRFGRTVPDNWLLFSQETFASGKVIHKQVDEWMSLSEGERPTALACTAGESCLLGIEMRLLSHGVRIGDKPGEFGLVGGVTMQLIGGPTWMTSPNSEWFMIEEMIREQLEPMVRHGEPNTRILRHKPELMQNGPAIDKDDLGIAELCMRSLQRESLIYS